MARTILTSAFLNDFAIVSYRRLTS